ncbi:odorant receptor 46a-like isoform X2 [Osmia bicornis bicornis]|uniref:odorant receptor 46a-like isoform X2 n=1 Tax=Osmia bicornis bicornis TaxID=1437191 RepID=UPI001EAE9544|nr:odorant receptor 46a-like isoform X2 [Osmia bicornis bicornis]
MVFLYVLCIAQILDIILNVENQNEFTENFAITSTVFMIALKFIMISTRRVNILILIEQLDKDLFSPVTKQEIKIRSEFDKIIEWTTKAYTMILGFFACGMFLATIAIDFKGRKLVSRIWTPYNYSSTSSYLLTNAYEFISAIFAVSVSIACETLYAALLLHICCQFEILQHRFKTLDGQENYMVNQCASHHHQIYMFARRVNSEFKGIVSCQFFTSMSVLCLNLYQMTNSEKLSMCMKSVLYSICVFSQIFYYCFYGNVVTEKSTDFPDVIFGSDWPSWNDSSKKILLMVIRRSRVPVEFTSMHVVSLNLKSFMSLLKTSYSAFNLMQTGR